MTLQEALVGILLAGLLSNNYAILHFLGTGAVIENERSVKKSLLIGAGTILTMVISTLITWPLDKYVLAKVPYFQTMVFVIVVMLVVWVMHLIAKGRIEGYCEVDFIKFAINGAVLGLCMNNAELSFGAAVLTAAAVGIGLTLTMIIFSALHDKIDEDSVPKAFRGLPISLLIAGLIALVLLAF